MNVIYSVFLPTPESNQHHKVKSIKPKDAPASYELDLELAILKEHVFELQGVAITERWLNIDQAVLMAEYRYSVSTNFDQAKTNAKNQLHEALKTQFLRQAEYDGDLIEEYVAVVIDDIKVSAQAFLTKHAYGISRFIRSIDEHIGSDQAKEILGTRINYNQEYLTVVDWEGAIIFAPQLEAQDDLELFMIANYQLLKYRILDSLLAVRLQALKTLVNNSSRTWLNDRKQLQVFINTQVGFLLDFDKIDRSLLLIGDWYSAKLYRLMVNKFYISEWRASVQNKLDNLAQIEEMVRQNFTLSWERLLDIVQLVGWLLLLIGYFALFYFDLKL